MSATVWPPDGWGEPSTIAHGAHAHRYWVLGAEGAPFVLLLHEFPGLSVHLEDLANRLARTYRVAVPSIVGRDGAATVRDSLFRPCIRREVNLLLRGAPAVAWLRALVDEVIAPAGRYAVIGMCMTGNFALAMALDPRVCAAVLAQPATPVLPWSLGLTKAERAALAGRDDLCVRGFRYEGDRISPAAKLRAAERLLGNAIVVHPLVPNKGKHVHSTLTGPTASPTALAELEQFLADRLGSAAPSS